MVFYNTSLLHGELYAIASRLCIRDRKYECSVTHQVLMPLLILIFFLVCNENMDAHVNINMDAHVNIKKNKMFVEKPAICLPTSETATISEVSNSGISKIAERSRLS